MITPAFHDLRDLQKVLRMSGVDDTHESYHILLAGVDVCNVMVLQILGDSLFGALTAQGAGESPSLARKLTLSKHLFVLLMKKFLYQNLPIGQLDTNSPTAIWNHDGLTRGLTTETLVILQKQLDAEIENISSLVTADELPSPDTGTSSTAITPTCEEVRPSLRDRIYGYAE